MLELWAPSVHPYSLGPCMLIIYTRKTPSRLIKAPWLGPRIQSMPHVTAHIGYLRFGTLGGLNMKRGRHFLVTLSPKA